MNYTPVHIDAANALTPRQRLAQMRKAFDLAMEANRYWPFARLVAAANEISLEASALAEDIRRTDEAIYGKATLRPVFVNTDTGGTMRAVVYTPNDTFDMPYIDETSWEGMKRILASDGSNIEVQADYEVYVVRGRNHRYIIHTIERFE